MGEREGGVKRLYAVSVDVTVYVVAESEAEAEWEGIDAAREEAMDGHANVYADQVEREEDVAPGWLGSIPYGIERDEPDMTCVEFLAHQEARPPTDPELEDLGQTTLAGTP